MTALTVSVKNRKSQNKNNISIHNIQKIDFFFSQLFLILCPKEYVKITWLEMKQKIRMSFSWNLLSYFSRRRRITWFHNQSDTQNCIFLGNCMQETNGTKNRKVRSHKTGVTKMNEGVLKLKMRVVLTQSVSMSRHKQRDKFGWHTNSLTTHDEIERHICTCICVSAVGGLTFSFSFWDRKELIITERHWSCLTNFGVWLLTFRSNDKRYYGWCSWSTNLC